MQEIHEIKLRLLGPQKIIGLSEGEVLNAKTFSSNKEKPEKNGLFCERIFGSVKSGVCPCGRFHKDFRRRKTACPVCNAPVTGSEVRSRRFGHITLAAPVVHIWYRKIIATLLDIPPRKFDEIIECKSFIVRKSLDGIAKEGDIISYRKYRDFKNSNEIRKRKIKAETGGTLVKTLLDDLDIDKLVRNLRKKDPSKRTNKRLQVANWFKQSGAKPVNMIIEVLPVMPPDLRPILFLEDGTVASSDINELYMRVIHRNNRLKKIIEFKSPEILHIVGMHSLQSAVDALISNGRRSSIKNRSGKRLLKSISDTISGKNGMLRRNLLGKRVDYSGRSVIAVGPELKLHQCGLPLDLAMDIFKPLVYGRLLRMKLAVNLKHAKIIVEKRTPAAIESLETIMGKKVVLLNRAPSLHRMSIQAFNPMLVSGKAIKLHPLVCSAFNADFDGDMMGVHLPLSIESQIEARMLMMSFNNIISPANSKLTVSPSQDIALGIYYLTKERKGLKGEGTLFADKEDALTALDCGAVDLHSLIRLRLNGERVITTPGRITLSEIFSPEIPFRIFNRTIKKKDLASIVELCFEKVGHGETVKLLDRIKDLGFKYATKSGTSLCMDDITIPKEKHEIIKDTENKVLEIEEQFNDGVIEENEKHNKIIDLWLKANDEITKKMLESFGMPDDGSLSDEQKSDMKEFNSVYMMADSGARGSTDQIRQIAGMRGLMAKPTGEIVETPIKSNLKEGLTYHEYLLAAHGARKGRADGALKTANAGYFTRKLADVAHDVIINKTDCGSALGRKVEPLFEEDEIIIPLDERIFGKVAAQDIISPLGEVIVIRNELISKDEAKKIADTGIMEIYVRSPITCSLKDGVCAMCYGYDLTTRKLVEIGEAVGIIAAQSIGEPGTQLTLRTFHSGGSASGGHEKSVITARGNGKAKLLDAVTIKNREGKPVVVNRSAFIGVISEDSVMREKRRLRYGAILHIYDEANVTAGQKLADWDPYNLQVIATTRGIAEYKGLIEGLTMKVETDRLTGVMRTYVTAILPGTVPKVIIGEKEYLLQLGSIVLVKDGDHVEPGDVIAKIPKQAVKNVDITRGLLRVLEILEVREIENYALMAEIDGEVVINPPMGRFVPVEIRWDETVQRTYRVPIEQHLNFNNGDRIKAGDLLYDGVIRIEDILHILGVDRATTYVIDEVQKVYRSQGVEINDKHLEIIVKKMLDKVIIVDPGDTQFVTDEIVSKYRFMEINRETEGVKATARQTIMGIAKRALESESWLSAASFQNTTSVLANAAIKESTDKLKGLKENIILGKLVPIGASHPEYRNTHFKRR